MVQWYRVDESSVSKKCAGYKNKSASELCSTATWYDSVKIKIDAALTVLNFQKFELFLLQVDGILIRDGMEHACKRYNLYN